MSRIKKTIRGIVFPANVMRYNAEGLAGLHDRPKGRPQRRLDAKEEADLVAVIERGPDPDVDGCCAWTRADLCRWLEAQCAKTYHPSSMSRVLRRLGFSRQKARPFHPAKDPEAQEAFKKGGLPRHSAAPMRWTAMSMALSRV